MSRRLSVVSLPPGRLALAIKRGAIWHPLGIKGRAIRPGDRVAIRTTTLRGDSGKGTYLDHERGREEADPLRQLDPVTLYATAMVASITVDPIIHPIATVDLGRFPAVLLVDIQPVKEPRQISASLGFVDIDEREYRRPEISRVPMAASVDAETAQGLLAALTLSGAFTFERCTPENLRIDDAVEALEEVRELGVPKAVAHAAALLFAAKFVTGERS